MAGDIYYNNVSLLLHCDGTNGSTTFTDNSPTPKTVTPVGNASVSTTQSKFNGASGYFDGSGDYLSIPDSTEFDFGSGDFTIEFWFRTNSITSQRTLISKVNSSGFGPFSIYSNGNSLYAQSSSNGTTWFLNSASGAPLSTNTWYHLALVRNGTNIRLYKNGTSEISVTSSATLVSNTEVISIGNNGIGPTKDFNGYIDDLRITKGIARYTSNFTAPTAAFDNTGPRNIIVGSIPVSVAVLATFNRKTNIVGNLPVTHTVAATLHKQLIFTATGAITASVTPAAIMNKLNVLAITGSVPITLTPNSPKHRRAHYFLTETVAITSVVAATLKKYHQSTLIGAIPVTISVNAVLLKFNRNQIIGGIQLTLTPASGLALVDYVAPMDVTGGSFKSNLSATFSAFQALAVTGAGFTSALACDFGGQVTGGNFISTLDSTLTGLPAFFIEGGSFTTTLDSAITYETLIDVTGGLFKSSLEANFGANVEGGSFTSSLSAELTGWASFSVNGGAFSSAVNIGITGSTSINVTGGGFRSQLLWMNVEGGGFKTALQANIAVTVSNSVAYILNIHTNESYQWSNMGFSHIISIGNKPFGIKADGLYELTGATDSGTAINALIKTKSTDFGSFKAKHVPYVYLNSDTATTIKPIVDDVQKTACASSFGGRKVHLSRKDSGRYHQYLIEGIVKLEGMEVLPEERGRRVK